MLVQIYRVVWRLIYKFKLNVIEREIKKNVALIGSDHHFGPTSRVKLFEGAQVSNVELHDHVEMFGTLTSLHHGKIVMRPWSKIGAGSCILAANYVEIGADTAIAEGVMIVDNNYHPINPEDRRYMRHTPHDSWERQSRHSANAPIYIGENVWIGSNVRICKGVTIGDNAIIAGNPAKIVKEDIDKTTTSIFRKD